jgi:hypothetical protein
MQEELVRGACYYILFKDDYTRYRFVYYIKNKLEALSCFEILVDNSQRIQMHGHDVKN